MNEDHESRARAALRDLGVARRQDRAGRPSSNLDARADVRRDAGPRLSESGTRLAAFRGIAERSEHYPSAELGGDDGPSPPVPSPAELAPNYPGSSESCRPTGCEECPQMPRCPRKAAPRPGKLGTLIGRHGGWYVRAHLEEGMLECVCLNCHRTYEIAADLIAHGESNGCRACAIKRRRAG
jgi:hypothetical protein